MLGRALQLGERRDRHPAGAARRGGRPRAAGSCRTGRSAGRRSRGRLRRGLERRPSSVARHRHTHRKCRAAPQPVGFAGVYQSTTAPGEGLDARCSLVGPPASRRRRGRHGGRCRRVCVRAVAGPSAAGGCRSAVRRRAERGRAPRRSPRCQQTAGGRGAAGQEARRGADAQAGEKAAQNRARLPDRRPAARRRDGPGRPRRVRAGHRRRQAVRGRLQGDQEIPEAVRHQPGRGSRRPDHRRRRQAARRDQHGSQVQRGQGADVLHRPDPADRLGPPRRRGRPRRRP